MQIKSKKNAAAGEKLLRLSFLAIKTENIAEKNVIKKWLWAFRHKSFPAWGLVLLRGKVYNGKTILPKEGEP